MKAITFAIAIPVVMLAASCASGPANRARAAEAAPPSAAPTSAAAPRLIREAPGARDYMVGLIESRKLVFLGELHEEVDPVLFLAENLKSFHDAGLRYLFSEGVFPGFMPIGTADSRYAEPFFIYFLAPWRKGGWKYEWNILSKAILELNARVSEGERLRIISAENGRQGSGETENDLLDSRDAYAFGSIVATMDSSPPEAKGLVFYGQSHGMKAGAQWTTMGGLLADRYGDSFASVAYDYLEDCFPTERGSKRIGDDRGTAVAIERSSSGDFLGLGSHIEHFDAFILDLGPKTYGVCYQYVQTRENLTAMFTTLMNFERSPRRDELLENPVNKDEYLLLVYYLKLYYGDLLDYDLWNPEGKLMDALEDMRPIFLGPGADPAAALAVRSPESLETLEEYHRLIREPRQGRPDIDAAECCAKAAEIFPEDLWPSCGLASALMGRGDYDGALALFDSILEKRLARSMYWLPEVYGRAAECAEVLGMDARAAVLRRERSALANEHGLDPPKEGL